MSGQQAGQPLAVVVGASRGLGHEICRELVGRGYAVFACMRSEPQEHPPAGIRIITGVALDDHEMAKSAVLIGIKLQRQAIDLLIFTAGLLVKEGSLASHPENYSTQATVNAHAPIFITSALHQHLQPGSKVVFLSSKMASMTLMDQGTNISYRMSKAALNAGACCLAQSLKPLGVAVAMLHPGAVRTDMYYEYHGHSKFRHAEPASESADGSISASQSVQDILKVVANLDLDNTGRFWNHDGSQIAW
ncbi:hypothetical protein WJX73_000270 [Symbiochloris irregularis]|uniref:Uncharacterized protein n=1 Tax=Symbiochloris irregularis TaxID=706552 RepID=A0AAW1PCT5_9CHLO